ncbi:hypothetical protein [Candidatus Rhodobacter oscarellae]|uniref:hypothetical protein n=1 Tax=Candidatus Rhodobacter oscarellae TaxID=1675527 RepID=UPI00128EA2AE|nr:hypothetical protein [Candidatus Rhodobacter lobularis]
MWPKIFQPFQQDHSKCQKRPFLAEGLWPDVFDLNADLFGRLTSYIEIRNEDAHVKSTKEERMFRSLAILLCGLMLPATSYACTSGTESKTAVARPNLAGEYFGDDLVVQFGSAVSNIAEAATGTAFRFEAWNADNTVVATSLIAPNFGEAISIVRTDTCKYRIVLDEGWGFRKTLTVTRSPD